VGPELVLEPAKGLSAGSLDALLAAAPPVFRTDRDRLRGRGAATAAAAVLGGWEGRSVALESFDPVSQAFAEAVVAVGGTLAAVGTPAGVVVAGPDGLAPDALAAAGTDAEALGALGRLDADASLFEVEADAVTAGSKAGVVDHLVAPRLRASVLVPVGPAPVTARGLAEAGRAGCRVLPDFLVLGGAAFASEAGADEALEAVEARALEAVTAAVHEVADHPEGLYLGACERAEAFLATWQDTLPFGRPLA
jgi:glutamate dehydrogenase/leucine dehydrogenase